jgi:hypothetical protein
MRTTPNYCVDMLISLSSRRTRRATGEGGVRDADPDAVATGGEHDVRGRRDVVRGAAGGVTGGPPERAGLGVRPGRRGLHPAATRWSVLPAGHPPLPRLLRLQHLLPAERQLRHRLQLRWRRNHHQEKSKFWIMQVPGIRDICCISTDSRKHVDDLRSCVYDVSSSESFPIRVNWVDATKVISTCGGLVLFVVYYLCKKQGTVLVFSCKIVKIIYYYLHPKKKKKKKKPK